MKYAINLNAVLPVRNAASEKSEMVTQLLFGETMEITGVEKNFFKIINRTDGYEGWVSSNIPVYISEEDYKALENQAFKICVPVAEVFSLMDRSIYRLPAGSLLPFFNPENNKFGIGNMVFQVHPSFVTYLPEGNPEGIVPVALHFKNSPYLWGGKTVFGIDCSGFTQTVFSICGIALPRDAGEQVLNGISVSFENLISGDLLFFEKDGKICHVAIYCANGQVIHASGKVKINDVDKQGILSDDKSSYTHFLSAIKRYT